VNRRDALHHLIDDFLAEKVPSAGGGWAPVDPDQVSQLNDIVHRLVMLKYGADSDGDYPIEWEIVDRTRFERLPYNLVPYDHAPDADLDYIWQVLHDNLSIALRGLQVFMDLEAFHARKATR